PLPSVLEEDLALLRHGESAGVDMVALSFVRRPEDVESVRSHTRLPLIAKMEKPEAVERASDIIKVADCVMVARGDLGIELAIERVPIVQKQLLELAGWMARPAITATQMLDSMVASSRPTRAEVADVANAILDGTDAVMLSQETAIGAYPVQAVSMMAAVAEQAESIAPYERWNNSRVRRTGADPAYTIAHNLCIAARALRLDALIVPTLSGRSARRGGRPAPANLARTGAPERASAGGAHAGAPVELGLHPTQLGDGRVVVHPLARDPMPVGACVQLREHGEREHLHAPAEQVLGPQRLMAHLAKVARARVRALDHHLRGDLGRELDGFIGGRVPPDRVLHEGEQVLGVHALGFGQEARLGQQAVQARRIALDDRALGGELKVDGACVQAS